MSGFHDYVGGEIFRACGVGGLGLPDGRYMQEAGDGSQRGG